MLSWVLHCLLNSILQLMSVRVRNLYHHIPSMMHDEVYGAPYCNVLAPNRASVMFGWLVVSNVPSTARSFRDGTPIYCPLRRT